MEERYFIKQVGQNKLPTKNCKHYVQEAQRNYGNSIFVFDGYDSNTTKTHAHVKRTKKTNSHIQIHQSINVTTEKDKFLFNEHNKSKLIEIMKKYFSLNSQTVFVKCRWRYRYCATALEVNHI